MWSKALAQVLRATGGNEMKILGVILILVPIIAMSTCMVKGSSWSVMLTCWGLAIAATSFVSVGSFLITNGR